MHQELHLLRQAAADDGVVLVQPEFRRLMGQQRFLQVTGHESAPFLFGRRARPLPGPGLLEPVDLGRADAHGTRRVSALALEPAVDGEQEAACEQEMQQRFSEPGFHGVSPQSDSVKLRWRMGGA